MFPTGSQNEIYIDLIDINGKKSVERRLIGDTIERDKTSKFTICTPRDENLGELKSAEMSERDDDAWIIDKVLMLCYAFTNIEKSK